MTGWDITGYLNQICAEPVKISGSQVMQKAEKPLERAVLAELLHEHEKIMCK